MSNKFDEDLIKRGESLHALMVNDDFKILLNEFEDRIRAEDLERERQEDSEKIVRATHRFRALFQLREWIDDEIAAASAEKLRMVAENK